MRLLPSCLASAVALLGLSTFHSSAPLTGVSALNVRLHGVNYNTRKGQDWDPWEKKCKNFNEIQQDMTTLKTITDRVRIYSLTDCDQGVQVLLAAKNAGLQVYLGMWTAADPGVLANEKAKLQELVDKNLIDSNVLGIFVGSETIFRKEITAKQAIAYLQDVRTFLRSKNLQTPLSIADTVWVYKANLALLDAVDFVAVNQFSFWSHAAIDEAGAIALDQIEVVASEARKRGKELMYSETGWSSDGTLPNTGVANAENQARFFKDFYYIAQAHNIKYLWFIAMDSQWRVVSPQTTCEGFFGIFHESGVMKDNFAQLSIAPNSAKAIQHVKEGFLSESNRVDLKVLAQAAPNDQPLKLRQQWYYHSDSQTVRSVWRDLCLEAPSATNQGAVRLSTCAPNNANLKWSYDLATRQLRHAQHAGFCLDYDAFAKRVQIWSCTKDNANQMWLLQ